MPYELASPRKLGNSSRRRRHACIHCVLFVYITPSGRSAAKASDVRRPTSDVRSSKFEVRSPTSACEPSNALARAQSLKSISSQVCRRPLINAEPAAERFYCFSRGIVCVGEQRAPKCVQFVRLRGLWLRLRHKMIQFNRTSAHTHTSGARPAVAQPTGCSILLLAGARAPRRPIIRVLWRQLPSFDVVIFSPDAGAETRMHTPEPSEPAITHSQVDLSN